MLYLVAILGLVAVTVWDATNIIRDFIYDNRVTAVSRVEIENKFPFLIDPVFCIYYEAGESVYPGQADQDEFYKSLISFMRFGRIDFIPKNISAAEMELTKNLYQLYIANHLIKKIDNEGSPWLDQMAKIIGIDRSEFGLLVNRFTENIENVDLAKRSWTDAQAAFLGGDGMGTTLGLAELYYIDFRYICIKMPLTVDLNPTNRSIAYGMDGFYVRTVGNGSAADVTGLATDKPAISSNRSSTDKAGADALGQTSESPEATMMRKRPKNAIATFFPEAETIHDQLTAKDNAFKANMEIFIFNHAVMDIRRFGDCTTDHDTEDDCLHDQKLSTIVKICKCVPFSWRMRSHISKNGPDGSSKTCSVEDYKRCWNEAIREWEKKRKKVKCVPCVTPKNRYQILEGAAYYEGLIEDKRNVWEYRNFFVVKCEERDYLLFEEKPQFTSSQFISQIGGDLGLYIGFSMIGLLQLIIMGCQTLERRRRVDAAASGEGAWKQMLQLIGNNLYGFGRTSPVEAEKYASSDAIKKLQERIEALEKLVLERK